jgi:hypothetical protein
VGERSANGGGVIDFEQRSRRLVCHDPIRFVPVAVDGAGDVVEGGPAGAAGVWSLPTCLQLTMKCPLPAAGYA